MCVAGSPPSLSKINPIKIGVCETAASTQPPKFLNIFRQRGYPPWTPLFFVKNRQNRPINAKNLQNDLLFM